ncbi:hypothetical protein [Ancylobacter mangrovi]|uniref:hypothetical protein n=1 Tax=Ancylobacter mangrovi TaxID=2972472 RepID=UPI002163046A|nr:hypothetical protein [Ancylobacter mangrovi]MCS0503959.1 hypothetical protein [Ancylobacter mangrovi]
MVYDRARRALLTQLRGAEPPLTEDDVAREQHALENAIRRLEAEYGGAPAPEEPRRAPPPQPEPAPAAPPPVATPPVAPPPVAPAPAPSMAEPPARAERPAPFAPSRPAAPTPIDHDEEDLYAAALGAPSPHLGAERRYPAGRSGEDFGGLRPEDEVPVDTGSAPLGEDADPAAPEPARPARGRLIAIAAVILLVIAGAVVGYTQRNTIIALMGRASGQQTTSVPADAPTAGASAPEVTKSTDRIAQAPGGNAPSATSSSTPSAAPSSSAQGTAAQGQSPSVAVAQRAVLFEESPGGGEQGLQQYVGTVVWDTENYSPGQGLAPDVGIRATITIPDRKMKVTLRIRRNQDESIPASHIVEIQYDLPPDFDLGAVANVPGMRAKAVEGASGAPLTGISVKVAPGYFLIGLSSLQAERQRNLGLLITRNWLDIPTVFENGRRAILVLEKGVPGDQAFRTAFSAWGLPLPPPSEPAN